MTLRLRKCIRNIRTYIGDEMKQYQVMVEVTASNPVNAARQVSCFGTNNFVVIERSGRITKVDLDEENSRGRRQSTTDL